MWYIVTFIIVFLVSGQYGHNLLSSLRKLKPNANEKNLSVVNFQARESYQL